MKGNCKWIESVLALIVIIFAAWPVAGNASKWVIIVAAVLILVHGCGCKNCMSCSSESEKSMGKSKKRR